MVHVPRVRERLTRERDSTLRLGLGQRSVQRPQELHATLRRQHVPRRLERTGVTGG